ncbi:MAG: [FeFe] hydrogenase H-cluster radical SAM maturase HydG [Acidobacteriota bacterium]|nr:[FeFe] hydrogenase H-cluster radical SAM maturase HydG [Acidobacteriota bacterium]
MIATARQHEKGKGFIDRDKLYGMLERPAPTEGGLDEILNRARRLKGLSLDDVASLLAVGDTAQIRKIMDCAHYVKEEIYGKRLVLFAPVYTGNVCDNNCVYCAFRKSNTSLRRKILTMDEIGREARVLLREGHKRVLLICGETAQNDTDYMCDAIRTVYRVREGGHYVRRINLELAPMEVADFARLKAEKIGTYVCFQETYDPEMYKKYHPKGTPKADYEYRVTVMDRAMEGGVNDVGLGVLFGLADYRFETLAIMEHAAHLEALFGCGPHTVSFPRIEPAENAPLASHVPHPVGDDDFKKIIAIVRIAMPYTGIILSTRENEQMRTELYNYGVSQISAGSRVNPGAYGDEAEATGSQFALGDHRSLDEVIASVVDKGYIPSFCTGCYRMGRVGNDFMDLAKPGLIKQYCMPNAVFTFEEYLNDFASPATKASGGKLVKELVAGLGDEALKGRMKRALDEIDAGKRDIYF